MNIIDAIKSGKRFKRRGQNSIIQYLKGKEFCWTKEEILADDWEIEEKSVTITESQLDKIIHGYKHIKAEPNYYLSFNDAIDYLKKELGFK